MNIISEGLKINFTDHIPCMGPFNHKHSKRDSDIITEEIQKLLQKKVVTKCDINEGDYFSSLFVRPDGHFEKFLIASV